MNEICKLLADSESDKHFIESSKTNRGRRVHKYGPIYGLLLHALYNKIQRPLKILEVGVATGISLVKWSELDFVDLVVGIDPGMDPLVEFNNKIRYSKHDGYTIETVEYLKEEYNKFDLIIDDGTHEWDHQKFFFENYFDLLNEHGVLFCEDVYTKYLDNFEKIKKDLGLYIIDLTRNINTDENEVIILRFKDSVI